MLLGGTMFSLCNREKESLIIKIMILFIICTHRDTIIARQTQT